MKIQTNKIMAIINYSREMEPIKKIKKFVEIEKITLVTPEKMIRIIQIKNKLNFLA